jgi:hypothetical protein
MPTSTFQCPVNGGQSHRDFRTGYARSDMTWLWRGGSTPAVPSPVRHVIGLLPIATTRGNAQHLTLQPNPDPGAHGWPQGTMGHVPRCIEVGGTPLLAGVTVGRDRAYHLNPGGRHDP